MDKKTPKARADKILSDILAGKTLFDNTKERLAAQVPISGKTAEYWHERFYLKIPDVNDMNPALLHANLMQIMVLQQEASFFFAESERANRYLKGGAEGAYHHAYWELVEEFKASGAKIPAAATLESLARVETIDTEQALINSETEMGYWKRIVEKLERSRKLLETASYTINSEAKAEKTADILQRMNRNKGDL
ncbi:MAG: hypothetical protein NWE76_02470 [Candidatus Bathyarchaeota archaeon]|nr:hypothetical protein [Candidatus Bathyarchaeota archaeon]